MRLSAEANGPLADAAVWRWAPMPSRSRRCSAAGTPRLALQTKDGQQGRPGHRRRTTPQIKYLQLHKSLAGSASVTGHYLNLHWLLCSVLHECAWENARRLAGSRKQENTTELRGCRKRRLPLTTVLGSKVRSLHPTMVFTPDGHTLAVPGHAFLAAFWRYLIQCDHRYAAVTRGHHRHERIHSMGTPQFGTAGRSFTATAKTSAACDPHSHCIAFCGASSADCNADTAARATCNCDTIMLATGPRHVVAAFLNRTQPHLATMRTASSTSVREYGSHVSESS